MIEDTELTRLLKVWPKLGHVDPRVLYELQHHAYYARIPTGKDIFAIGDQVETIALLISGAVRVYKVSETGREITLYRFSKGEACILTANAILNSEAFSAIATVEQEAEAIMIPANTFRSWINQYEVWREFVFDLLSRRLSSVMEIVDEVAFGRMDIRIATFLLASTKNDNSLRITHQEIADELGSSREVISRILEEMAAQNFIQLGRGAIEIIDDEGLKSYAGM